jgi:hypothetical protein
MAKRLPTGWLLLISAGDPSGWLQLHLSPDSFGSGWPDFGARGGHFKTVSQPQFANVQICSVSEFQPLEERNKSEQTRTAVGRWVAARKIPFASVRVCSRLIESRQRIIGEQSRTLASSFITKLALEGRGGIKPTCFGASQCIIGRLGLFLQKCIGGPVHRGILQREESRKFGVGGSNRASHMMAKHKFMNENSVNLGWNLQVLSFSFPSPQVALTRGGTGEGFSAEGAR